MTRLTRISFLAGCALIFALSPLSSLATTYYVSYSGGSDSNTGTSESSPWKHAPGMMGLTPSGSSTGDGCLANCASYVPAAGDKIVLKGGDVWPYTTAPWVFSWSGTGSTSTYGCQGTGCIYVGNAIGAGLPAWNDGTVTGIWLKRDLGGWNPSSPPSVSCSGGGGSGAAATVSVVPAADTNDPNISGMIYNVALTASGSGYTSAPTCVLTGGGGTATLGADIDRAVFDLGATQSTPPDWPLGKCGSYPNTCSGAIALNGQYVILSGVEVRNMRMQQNTSSGTNDEHTTMVFMNAAYQTVSNIYVHGLFVDCYYSGSCSASQDSQWDAIGDQNPYDEVANSVVEDGDAAFLGTSSEAQSNICTADFMCTAASFGIANQTQDGYGPNSVHGNIIYADFWQLRFVGNDASGSDPYLSYGNEMWLTLNGINPNSHLNARYMQLDSPAELISYDNIVHSEVGGTSSQIQCPSGATFYYFDEVSWGLGNGTPAYGLDMNDVGGTGGCSLYLYNDTVDTAGSSQNQCVASQSGSKATTIVMQNLDCISGSTALNPFWATASNSKFENQAGSTAQATVEASSVEQSTTTAASQSYSTGDLFAPQSSSDDTVTFASSASEPNLTSLCSGYLTALCKDLKGNARPATGGWNAGAYQYGNTTQPASPTSLTGQAVPQ